MAEYEDVELTSSHRHIYRWNNSHRTSTDVLMLTSRRPQTPKRTRQISMEPVGRKKKKKRKQDKTCAAGREVKKKKGSRTLGSILTRREVTWDRKGASEAKEERATTGLWQAGQRETCKDGRCHLPVHPSLRHVSTGEGRVGC